MDGFHDIGILRVWNMTDDERSSHPMAGKDHHECSTDADPEGASKNKGLSYLIRFEYDLSLG